MMSPVFKNVSLKCAVDDAAWCLSSHGHMSSCSKHFILVRYKRQLCTQQMPHDDENTVYTYTYIYISVYSYSLYFYEFKWFHMISYDFHVATQRLSKPFGYLWIAKLRPHTLPPSKPIKHSLISGEDFLGMGHGRGIVTGSSWDRCGTSGQPDLLVVDMKMNIRPLNISPQLKFLSPSWWKLVETGESSWWCSKIFDVFCHRSTTRSNWNHLLTMSSLIEKQWLSDCVGATGMQACNPNDKPCHTVFIRTVGPCSAYPDQTMRKSQKSVSNMLHRPSHMSHDIMIFWYPQKAGIS